jgi:hypothetical protein
MKAQAKRGMEGQLRQFAAWAPWIEYITASTRAVRTRSCRGRRRHQSKAQQQRKRFAEIHRRAVCVGRLSLRVHVDDGLL